MVEGKGPSDFFQCMEMQKWKIDLKTFHGLDRTMLQYMVCLESYKIGSCKRYVGPYYGQFMILMHAILLYGQFMTFMQPYVTIYNLVFISCFFLYGSTWEYIHISSHFSLCKGKSCFR